MKSTPYEYHKDHSVKVLNSAKLRGQCYYYCMDCNKWVGWLSREDSKLARELGLVSAPTMQTAERSQYKEH